MAFRTDRWERAAGVLLLGRDDLGRGQLLARFSDVRGELVLSDRFVNLVEEGVDVAVRIGALEDSSLRIRTAGATRRVLVASRSYLGKHKRPRTPKDLRDHALIHVTPLAPLPEWQFFKGKRRERIAIRPAFVTNAIDAAVVHARRGQGIAMVLSYQVAHLVRAGELDVLLSKYEPPTYPINLAYMATREPSASVRAFIDMTVSTRSWTFVDL
jgi:DNA-binding transcriptional LysR family regulator